MHDTGREKVSLVALRISNGALAGAELPAEIRLLGWGANPSLKGPITVDEFTAASLPQQQKQRGFDRIALDFEHNTVPGTPEFDRTKEPRDVAAYGAPVVVPGQGLMLRDLVWTPAGREHARSFADLSPTVKLDERGRVEFIHSAALVRNGAVEGLSFFSVDVPSTKTPDKKPMEPNQIISVADLAGLLGLSATAGKDDVLARLKTHLAAPPDLTPLTARLTTLEAGARAGELARLKAGAAAAGKVIPLSDEDMAKMDLATLSAMIEKLPAGTVTLTAANRAREAGAATAAGNTQTINAAVQEHRRKTGCGFEEAWNAIRAEKPELFRMS